MNDINGIASKFVRTQRLSTGLGQTEFADKIGIKRSTLSNYELGNIKMRIKIVDRIILATNSSWEYFAEFVEKERSSSLLSDLEYKESTTGLSDFEKLFKSTLDEE